MQKTSVALESTACNCLALRQAARHVSQIYDAHLALVGLRTTQYSILEKLKRLGPLSINELANSMVMDRTTLGRAIRPLEQRDKLHMAIGGGDDGRTRSSSSHGYRRRKGSKLRSEKWREAQQEFETAFRARTMPRN